MPVVADEPVVEEERPVSAPGVVLLTESVVEAEAAREAEGSTTSPAVRSPADERVGGAVVEPVVDEWVADDEWPWPVEVVSAVLSECEKTCLICGRRKAGTDSSDGEKVSQLRSCENEICCCVGAFFPLFFLFIEV